MYKSSKFFVTIIILLFLGTSFISVSTSTISDDQIKSNMVYELSTLNQYVDTKSDDCRFNDRSIISDLSEINNKIPSSVDFSNEDFPDYFNWRDYEGKDWTTPVKNQGKCTSCGVIASVGSLESVIKIREGCADMNPDLSAQYVLSCLPAAANEYGKGCTYGNFAGNVYKYIISTTEAGNYHNGIIWESCFPYQAKDLNQGVTCDQKCSDWLDYLVPISDYGSIWNYDVDDNTPESIELIKNTVMQHGPTVGGMYSTIKFSIWGLLHHSPEDYYPDKGEGSAGVVNHEVIIVGWNDDPSISNGGYWICESTWGTKFGYDGFFNIEYGALFTGVLLEWVDYDPESFDWPPTTPFISGSKEGIPGNNYTYILTSEDPDGDDEIYYYIDWDDGTNSDWLGPYTEGEEIAVNHTWTSKGTYIVKAKAKDPSGSESQWRKLTVTMPRNRPITSPFLNFLHHYSNLFPLLRLLLQRFGLQ